MTTMPIVDAPDEQAHALSADDALDGGGAGLATSIDRAFKRYAPLIAMAAAIVATLGSLYFSEVRDYEPCRLCWFQRIFMYPLAFLLPIGILRKDRGLKWYVLPLAAIGAPISIYHVLMQKTNWVSDSAACLVSVPCSGQYINWLGFISIPVLALVAFTIILLTASVTVEAGPDGRLRWPGARSVVLTVVAIAMVFAVLWWARI